jgi:hypothetical protein
MAAAAGNADQRAQWLAIARYYDARAADEERGMNDNQP